jgi:hypothetical protein
MRAVKIAIACLTVLVLSCGIVSITEPPVKYYGDSITRGCAVTFPEIFDGSVIAKGGLTANGLIPLIVNSAAPSEANILIGINDYLTGGTLDDYLWDMNMILSKFSPDDKVTVTGLLVTRLNSYREMNLWNEPLKRLVEFHGFEYVDRNPEFMNGAGFIRDELTYDGLHLTRDGCYLLFGKGE